VDNQRPAGIALDQQEHLTALEQRGKGSRHRRLRIAASHDDDRVSAVDSSFEISCSLIDRGEFNTLASNLQAAVGSNLGKL
jgi:hypothetical protein